MGFNSAFKGLIQRTQSRLFYAVPIRIPCKSSYHDIQALFSTVQNNILQAQYVEFLRHFSLFKS